MKLLSYFLINPLNNNLTSFTLNIEHKIKYMLAPMPMDIISITNSPIVELIRLAVNPK